METVDGRVAVSTVFDLMMAHFGVGRGLPGDYPANYDDEDSPFTPAWQEKYSGIHRETVIRFARQWADNAEKTGGKNLLIIGNRANQWYHTNLDCTCEQSPIQPVHFILIASKLLYSQ